MTQEDKDLLLKDLCGRSPYGVKCCIYNFGGDTIRIKEDILWSVQGDNILTLKSYVEKGEAYMYHQIKPYLFPLSSMTEEQKEEYRKACDLDTEILSKHPMDETPFPALHNSQDWLNAHHFDYRGLIPMGLANDSTRLNIY